MSTEAVTNRNQQLAVSPPVELPIITRAEAMRLLRNAGVNMFSRNAVLLLENAVRGTYTKYVDNAERPSRQTVKYLFRGVMSRQKRNEKFYGVEDRQIYNLLKEVQDIMRPQRADEKIRYQNFNR